MVGTPNGRGEAAGVGNPGGITGGLDFVGIAVAVAVAVAVIVGGGFVPGGTAVAVAVAVAVIVGVGGIGFPQSQVLPVPILPLPFSLRNRVQRFVPTPKDEHLESIIALIRGLFPSQQ